MDYQQHAKDFLEFCAKNEKKLKNNLKKNITYNEQFFDDVYHDTIIKIYEYIQRGKEIKNFESFFFICSKNNYIMEDNRNKKLIKTSRPQFIHNVENGMEMRETEEDKYLYDEYVIDQQEFDNELYLNNISTLMKQIYDIIEQEFGYQKSDIYMIYYKLKTDKNRISYQKMADIMQVNVNYIRNTIQEVKQYVNYSEQINKIKNDLLYDN